MYLNKARYSRHPVAPCCSVTSITWSHHVASLLSFLQTCFCYCTVTIDIYPPATKRGNGKFKIKWVNHCAKLEIVHCQVWIRGYSFHFLHVQNQSCFDDCLNDEILQRSRWHIQSCLVDERTTRWSTRWYRMWRFERLSLCVYVYIYLKYIYIYLSIYACTDIACRIPSCMNSQQVHLHWRCPGVVV